MPSERHNLSCSIPFWEDLLLLVSFFGSRIEFSTVECPVFHLLGLGADLLFDVGVDPFPHVLFELLKGQLLLGLGLFDAASVGTLGYTPFVAWADIKSNEKRAGRAKK